MLQAGLSPAAVVVEAFRGHTQLISKVGEKFLRRSLLPVAESRMPQQRRPDGRAQLVHRAAAAGDEGEVVRAERIVTRQGRSVARHAEQRGPFLLRQQIASGHGRPPASAYPSKRSAASRGT